MSEEIVDKDDVSSPKTAVGAWFRSITQGFVYDEFGIKTEFQAKVLARPIFTSGREKAGENTTQHSKYMFKARVLGNPSPHDYLPDPCDASIAANEEEALQVIGFHTTFISNSDFAVSGFHAPKVGDLVNVRLEPGKFSYDLQTGTHLGIVNVNNAIVRQPSGETKEQKICTSLVELFGTGEISIGEIGEIYGVRAGEVATPITGAPAQSGVDFYHKLRDSLYFKAYSNNFLIGLMVNAQNESTRNLNIFHGDCGSSNPNSLSISGRKCCSFGYWHLNICAGAGRPYIEWLNSDFAKGPGTTHGADWVNYDDLPDDSARYNMLIKWDNQAHWLSWHLKGEIFNGLTGSDNLPKPKYTDKSIGPRPWAQHLSHYFERCDGCFRGEREYKERGLTAASYAAGDLSSEVDTQ
jgi:hypothetical protein